MIATVPGRGSLERHGIEPTGEVHWHPTVSQLYMHALERGDGQVYNIGSGIGTSVNQIYEKLQQIIRVSSPPDYSEARTGEIQRTYLESSKAKRELGWSAQIGFDEGLRKTVDWFRKHLAAE